MNLGFMGGCLNKQIGLSKELLYHYVLLDLMSRNFPGSKFEGSLGYYTSYNLMPQAATRFIEQKSPDRLFLFLRPFPLMALNKLWIKFNTKDKENTRNGHSRKLHPSLFKRGNMEWAPNLTNYSLEDAVLEAAGKKFGWRDLNLLSGLMTGLNNWSVRYLVKEIEEINKVCFTHKTELILLSLPQNPESVLGNYICNLTNKKLKLHLPDIAFIDISFIGKKYFYPDGIHYNEEGHKILAEVLCDYLSQTDLS